MNLVQHVFMAASGIAHHPLLWLRQLSENQTGRDPECLVTNSVQGKIIQNKQDKNYQTIPIKPLKTYIFVLQQ